MKVVIEGLAELEQRLSKSPEMLDRMIKESMYDSLGVLRENVPPYPRQSPDTDYIRTGMLGRSLGSSQQGGIGGQTPDIWQVTGSGRYTVGEFGTRLNYAPYVVGTEQQSGIMADLGWWVFEDIAVQSDKKIRYIFELMARNLLEFIAGKGT